MNPYDVRCRHCREPLPVGTRHYCFDCGHEVCARCVQTCWHTALRRSVEVCPACGRKRLNAALAAVDLPTIVEGICHAPYRMTR